MAPGATGLVIRNALANGRVPRGYAFRRFLMEMASGAPAPTSVAHLATLRPANVAVEGVPSCAAPALAA